MHPPHPSRLSLCAAVTMALLVAACAVSRPAVAPDDASTGTLALTGVTVIDPATATVRRAATIIIRGDRILSVDDGRQIPSAATVIDGTGKYVIPGLWDSHVHFMNTGVSALPLLLANGVTSVREMGGYLEWTRAWQKAMADGTLAGPRILTAGPIIEAQQYLDRVRRRDEQVGGRLAPRVVPYRIGVLTPAQAESAVGAVHDRGVDFIKFRSAPSRDAYFALLRAARGRGMKVSGHQPDFATVAEAAENGQSSIEHRLRLDRGETHEDPAATFASMARNGTRYTPGFIGSIAGRLRTLEQMRDVLATAEAPTDPNRRYISQCLVDWWAVQLDDDGGGRKPEEDVADVYRSYEADYRNLRQMLDAGVHVLAGTDAGSTFVYPGASLHEELEILSRSAGVSPWAALRAATSEPADFFGSSDLGRIGPGYVADLVVLDADPVADIRHTRSIAAVVQNGRYLSRKSLDRLLETVETLNRRTPATISGSSLTLCN